MIDWARILGFDWDEDNSRKSVDKHSVSQQEAEHAFLDSRLLVLSDDGHSGEEMRYQAYGETATGRRLHVSFTLRHNATVIRVISARVMSRKERARYDEEA